MSNYKFFYKLILFIFVISFATSSYSQFLEEESGEWAKRMNEEIAFLPPEIKEIIEVAVENARLNELSGNLRSIRNSVENQIADAILTHTNVPLDACDNNCVEDTKPKNNIRYETFEVSEGEGEGTEDKKKRTWKIVESVAFAIVKQLGPQLNSYVLQIIDRLSLPEDIQKPYEIFLSPSFSSNDIFIDPKNRKVSLPLAIFLNAESESELAAQIAHELTHANPKHMELLREREEIEKLIDHQVTQGSTRTDANDNFQWRNRKYSQREELRAEIGAVDRLIKGGFNPWGIYSIRKKFQKIHGATKKSIAEIGVHALTSTHPLNEIFISASKAYILNKLANYSGSGINPLMNQVQLKTPLSSVAKKVRSIATFAVRTIGLGIILGPKQLSGVTLLSLIGIYYEEIIRFITSVSSSNQHAGVSVSDLDNISSGNQHAGVSVSDLDNIFISFSTHIKESLIEPISRLPVEQLVTPETSVIAVTSVVGFYIKRLFNKLSKKFKNNSRKIEEYKKVGEELIDSDELNVQKFKNFFIEVHRLYDWHLTDLENYSDSIVDKALVGYYKLTKRGRELLIWTHEFFAKIYLPKLVSKAKGNPRHMEMLWKYVVGLSNSLTNFVDTYRDIKFRQALSYWTETINDSFERQYDPDDLNLNKKFDKQELELDFEHKLRLLNLTPEDISKLSTLEKIQLLKLVYQSLPIEFATQIIISHHDEIRDFLFNPHVNSKDNIADYIRVVQFILSTYRNDTRMKKKILKGLNRERLIAMLSSEERRLHDLSIRSSFYTHDKKFSKTVLKDEVEFTKNLAKFTSLEELSNYLRKLTLNISALASYIQEHVLSNLDLLIKTPRDVSHLLEFDYFWKTLYSSVSNKAGEYEYISNLKQSSPKGSNSWKYDIRYASTMHKKIVEVLKATDAYPTTFEGLFDLWCRMTDRGISLVTDDMAKELSLLANTRQIKKLEKKMLYERRVWDPEYIVLLINKHLERTGIIEKISNESDTLKRSELIDQLLKSLEKMCPEKSYAYRELLERISNAIRSSEKESALFELAKGEQISGDAKSQEISIRVLSKTFAEALTWSYENQLKLIKFLRGDISSFEEVEALFPILGADRIKRLYDTLPIEVRTVLVFDPFLDSENGLLSAGGKLKGWPEKLTSYVLSSLPSEQKLEAQELLNAFLYAMEKTSGDKGARTYILSYILAMPSSENSSIGEVLKTILSMFGSTGIKIAQNIVASNILGDVETEKLRSTQSAANPPTREEVYNDLRELFNNKIPFRFLDLLGSASLKYAILYQSLRTGRVAVGKILRKKAYHNIELEFAQLEHMTDYLIRHYKEKYGVLAAIVESAKSAVKKELNLRNEVLNSFMASHTVYKNRDGSEVIVDIPKEIVHNDRLILSQYANGTSFFELSPENRELVAKAILAIEEKILFSEANDISFEPDRHAGNLKIKIITEGGKVKIILRHFDFGQYVSNTISRNDRDQILKIFAFAQIFSTLGPLTPVIANFGEALGLNSDQIKLLSQRIKKYFTKPLRSEVWAYFSLLSSLSEAHVPIKPEYFDYIRAILQLNQFEKYLTNSKSEELSTPHKTLKKRVLEIIDTVMQDTKLKFMDYIELVRRNGIRMSFSLLETKLVKDQLEVESQKVKLDSKPNPVKLLRCIRQIAYPNTKIK